MQETVQQLRKQVLSQVTTAAANGLTNEIAELATLAKACDNALQMANDLDAEVDRIREELANMSRPEASVAAPVSQRPAKPAGDQQRKAGARERGRKAREIWITRAARTQGIRLRRLGEVSYETASRKTVGIAYASEAPGRTYPWWLGLPDEKPDYVVLLCEEESGAVVDFVFLPSFVSQIWNSLSRDTNHHVKFHVLRVGPNWELKLKNGPLVPINEYKGKPGVLR